MALLENAARLAEPFHHLIGEVHLYRIEVCS